MKNLHVALISLIILASSLVTIASCAPEPKPPPTSPSSQTPTTPLTPTQTSTTQPAVAPFTPEPGMVCLYYWKVTSSQPGSYLNVPGEGEIQVPGSAFGGFYRYVFNADNDSIVDYTGNDVGGYSVEENGGNLFFIFTPKDFSSLTIQQAGINTNPKIITNPSGTVVNSGGTHAIVGDYIYYHLTKDPLTYFLKKPLAGGNDITLLHGSVGGVMSSEDDYLLNFGSLYSVRDNLYQVITKISGEEIIINQLDLSTGNIAKQTTWQFNTNDYSAPKFFTDDQALYYVAATKNPVTSATGEPEYSIDIFRLTQAEFDAGQGWDCVEDINTGNGPNAPEIQFATADDNYILLGYHTSGGSTTLLYDPSTGQANQVSMPNGATSGQLYIVPPSLSTPSSPTSLITPPVIAGITGPLTLAQNCSLTVSVSPPGSGDVVVQGAAVWATQTQVFPEFTKVTLTAAPAKGYKFSNWSGISGATSSSNISLTIVSNVNIVANFTSTQATSTQTP